MVPNHDFRQNKNGHNSWNTYATATRLWYSESARRGASFSSWSWFNPTMCQSTTWQNMVQNGAKTTKMAINGSINDRRLLRKKFSCQNNCLRIFWHPLVPILDETGQKGQYPCDSAAAQLRDNADCVASHGTLVYHILPCGALPHGLIKPWP